MYSSSKLALKYFNYYFTSSNGKGHGTHSPFVFHFIKEVLNDRNKYGEYEAIENLRQQLSRDKAILTVEDFGAGSSVSKTNRRSIASITKNAAKPKKYGQLLFRMVKAYQPKSILELGTSLGITTSYLASANPSTKVITMEGASAIASIARQNFSQLKLNNINIVEGNFDTTLSSVIDQLPSLDLAFIDGNHRQAPTEQYFQQLSPKINNDSILVFDDIHWSEGMEKAWATIQGNPAVRCTIDLFFIGIVLFRREFKEKQHFTIRF